MTATDGAFEQSRDHLRRLIDISKIARVVLVDDDLAHGARLEEVLALVEDAWEQKGPVTLSEVELLKEILSTTNKELTLIKIRKQWEEWDDNQRESLSASLSHLVETGTEKKADTEEEQGQDLAGLAMLFQKIIEYRSMSFTDWREEAGRILKESKKKRTLIFFDKDLTNDGGGANEGEVQIISLLTKAKAEGWDIWCGLLSQYFRTSEEYVTWMNDLKGRGIPTERVLPFSKDRLSEDYTEFVKQL